jgi:hypothetical protein
MAKARVLPFTPKAAPIAVEPLTEAAYRAAGAVPIEACVNGEWRDMWLYEDIAMSDADWQRGWAKYQTVMIRDTSGHDSGIAS